MSAWVCVAMGYTKITPILIVAKFEQRAKIILLPSNSLFEKKAMV